MPEPATAAVHPRAPKDPSGCAAKAVTQAASMVLVRRSRCRLHQFVCNHAASPNPRKVYRDIFAFLLMIKDLSPKTSRQVYRERAPARLNEFRVDRDRGVADFSALSGGGHVRSCLPGGRCIFVTLNMTRGGKHSPRKEKGPAPQSGTGPKDWMLDVSR